MDLETIMLSEISQTEKDKYGMISLVGSEKKLNSETDQMCCCQRQELRGNG